jgi:hypothetical protein
MNYYKEVVEVVGSPKVGGKENILVQQGGNWIGFKTDCISSKEEKVGYERK